MATAELASLRDIHLPVPIHHWPVAMGWWILYGLLVLGLAWGIYTLYRHYINERPKREALTLLNLIKQSHLNHICDTCKEVNHLLKRVTLAYYPRNEVAELHGKAWLNFLSQTSQGLDMTPYQDYLLRFPYQKKISQPLPHPEEVKAFLEMIGAWIKQQRRQG